jgi:hypothetical protein
MLDLAFKHQIINLSIRQLIIGNFNSNAKGSDFYIYYFLPLG